MDKVALVKMTDVSVLNKRARRYWAISTGAALQQSAVTLGAGRTDGVLSKDGQILGTYLHGLFDHPQARDALLRWAGLRPASVPGVSVIREQQLERLADVVERELDCSALFPGVM